MEILLYRVVKDGLEGDQSDYYVAIEGTITNIEGENYMDPQYLLEDEMKFSEIESRFASGCFFNEFICPHGYTLQTKKVNLEWDDF